MSNEVIDFQTDAKASPQTLLLDLQQEISEVEQLFMVVKYKDGQYGSKVAGKSDALAYAIAILQEFLLESI